MRYKNVSFFYRLWRTGNTLQWFSIVYFCGFSQQLALLVRLGSFCRHQRCTTTENHSQPGTVVSPTDDVIWKQPMTKGLTQWNTWYITTVKCCFCMKNESSLSIILSTTLMKSFPKEYTHVIIYILNYYMKFNLQHAWLSKAEEIAFW